MAEAENSEENTRAHIIGRPYAPGFVRARAGAGNDPDFERQQESDARAAKDERAAFVRAARKQEEDEEAKNRAAEKSGFKAASDPAAGLPGDNETAGGAGFAMRGEGWIYCGKDQHGRGTWLKDCGDSIEVPFSPTRGMSEGQQRKILELREAKGWTTLYAFKSNGYTLHKLATQQLQSAGIPCCTATKGGETLNALRSLCSEYHNKRCEASANQPHMRQGA